MMRVGIEQDALDARRKFGRQQNFRQVVDKDITSLAADALELFRDCQIEEYVLGRDQTKARLAAVCDALWQNDRYRATVERDVLAPIRTRLETERAQRRAQTAATRVDFFTLVRGED